MVSFKTIFAYIIFALAAVVLFLYLLFPDQAVKAIWTTDWPPSSPR
jgi:hypothetical protein